MKIDTERLRDNLTAHYRRRRDETQMLPTTKMRLDALLALSQTEHYTQDLIHDIESLAHAYDAIIPEQG